MKISNNETFSSFAIPCNEVLSGTYASDFLKILSTESVNSHTVALPRYMQKVSNEFGDIFLKDKSRSLMIVQR